MYCGGFGAPPITTKTTRNMSHTEITRAHAAAYHDDDDGRRRSDITTTAATRWRCVSERKSPYISRTARRCSIELVSVYVGLAHAFASAFRNN